MRPATPPTVAVVSAKPAATSVQCSVSVRWTTMKLIRHTCVAEYASETSERSKSARDSRSIASGANTLANDGARPVRTRRSASSDARTGCALAITMAPATATIANAARQPRARRYAGLLDREREGHARGWRRALQQMRRRRRHRSVTDADDERGDPEQQRCVFGCGGDQRNADRTEQDARLRHADRAVTLDETAARKACEHAADVDDAHEHADPARFDGERACHLRGEHRR